MTSALTVDAGVTRVRLELRHLVLAALVFRLAAAVLARGYGMHDDHFAIIETAQDWVEGRNLPSPSRTWMPNATYVGLHYLLFRGLDAVGAGEPQAKMLVVRGLHAAYSVLAVVLAAGIARRLAGRSAGILAGLLVAFLWPAPFLSVRNLVEVVVIPPLLWSVQLLLDDRGAPHRWRAVAAGVAGGLAFVVRIQVAPFLAALWVLVLLERRWRAATAFAAGALLPCAILQGGLDAATYGAPFATLIEYVGYNDRPENQLAYTTGPWYAYLGTLAGLLIPPASLLLLALFASAWRRASYLVVPTLAFLALHSLIPNKQERFILPIVPCVSIAAAVGWAHLVEAGRLPARWLRSLRWAWGWFWAVNACLLVVATATYSKRTRVELMTFLRQARAPAAVIETTEDRPPMMPRFYLGRPCRLYEVSRTSPLQRLARELREPGAVAPAYVAYLGDEGLGERVAAVGRLLPGQVLARTIEPSFADWVLWRLNPHYNVNQTAYVYRVGRVGVGSN